MLCFVLSHIFLSRDLMMSQSTAIFPVRLIFSKIDRPASLIFYLFSFLWYLYILLSCISLLMNYPISPTVPPNPSIVLQDDRFYHRRLFMILNTDLVLCVFHCASICFSSCYATLRIMIFDKWRGAVAYQPSWDVAIKAKCHTMAYGFCHYEATWTVSLEGLLIIFFIWILFARWFIRY